MEGAAAGSESSKDQTGLSFQDIAWLEEWGLGPENALEYFSLSPFYDRSCNNEHCRMQGLDPRQALPHMTGLEYALSELPPEDHFGPPLPEDHPPAARRLFVIYKQFRRSPASADIRSAYYLMEGTIYQAPTVHSLITSRLEKIATHMDRVVTGLEKLRVLNPECGYDWKWNAEAAAQYRKGERPPVRTEATQAIVESILLDLVKKYAPEGGEQKLPLPLTAKEEDTGMSVAAAAVAAAAAAAAAAPAAPVAAPQAATAGRKATAAPPIATGTAAMDIG